MKYDGDWSKVSCCMSFHEMAFLLDMLCCLHKEILIGPVSYKHRTDNYNDIHEYYGKCMASGEWLKLCTCDLPYTIQKLNVHVVIHVPYSQLTVHNNLQFVSLPLPHNNATIVQYAVTLCFSLYVFMTMFQCSYPC